MSIQNVSVTIVCNFCKHLVQAQTVSPKLWTVLLNDVTFYVISRHWFIDSCSRLILTHLKHGFCKTLNVVGLAANGFEISMYFYVKVHFQKNFISKNKVHCVLNRARTLTII